MGEHRQNPGDGIAPLEEHGNLQKVRGVHLNENIIDRRRHGVDNHDKQGAEFIPELALGTGHGRAQGNAQRHGQRHGQKPQQNGHGSLLGDDAANGCAHPIAGGSAQISPQQAGKKVLQLHGDGVVQAQRFQPRIDDRGAELIIIFEIALDGHLAKKHKYDGQHDHQGNGRAHQPAQNITQQEITSNP